MSEAGPGLDLDSPFWRFALAVYARPDVPPLCLSLQDEHGIDVDLLLFAGWCGRTGRELTAADIAAAAAHAAEWIERVVRPLRQARRAWKEIGPEAAAAQNGRETLKSVELLSERIVCAMLHGIHDGLGKVAAGGAGREGVIRANLALVLARSGVAPARIETACEVLAEACRASG